MENKISFVISEEAKANISKAMETIIENLPGLVNLKAADRRALPKMGDKSFAFVSKAFEYAAQNPKVVPAFLDMAEFEKDTVGTAELKKVLISMHQLVEKLDDTTLLTGSDALASALVFYTALKGAAKAGEPGMKTVYADLQSRYPGHAKGTTPSSPVVN